VAKARGEAELFLQNKKMMRAIKAMPPTTDPIIMPASAPLLIPADPLPELLEIDAALGWRLPKRGDWGADSMAEIKY